MRGVQINGIHYWDKKEWPERGDGDVTETKEREDICRRAQLDLASTRISNYVQNYSRERAGKITI